MRRAIGAMYLCLAVAQMLGLGKGKKWARGKGKDKDNNERMSNIWVIAPSGVFGGIAVSHFNRTLASCGELTLFIKSFMSELH